jgi:hypothetical protein
MKNVIILTLLMVFAASSAFALKVELQRDGQGQKIQGFAPDGKKSQALTVVYTVVDTSNDTAWESYTPTACSFRLQSTATKAGMKLSLPANARIERKTNLSTPFVSYTGCTSGELQRQ